MNPILIPSLRSLLADPDRPDRDALLAVLDDTQTARVLACLAPPRSLAQIAAALRSGWAWYGDGWERQIDELVALITDPRCSVPEQMITTWRRIPSAVDGLRDRTDDLVTWAQQRIHPIWYADLAILLGPSDAAARLLMRYPSSHTIGRTLRRWSMAINPDNPTAWQAMIDATLRKPLRRKATPSWSFPSWGWNNAVDSGTVLDGIVDDLFNGWSPDHPSLRGRIGWIEHHISSYLDIGKLARVASIGRSDALAEAVCVRVLQNHWNIRDIVHAVPWSQLHPRIQTVIDTTMRQASDQWARTWACALGRSPIMPDNDIDASLLLWRIAPERWEALNAALRAALVSRITFPGHCFGWGVHPDLVAGKSRPNGRDVRFWNPDVPPDDLHAWDYADLLRAQSTLQEAREMIALLDILHPNRRTRFAQIIDWHFGGRTEATAKVPWDWVDWASLPAADRQTAIGNRLAVLWGTRASSPAVHLWRARNDGLATLALIVGDILGLNDPTPILAALLAQVLVLQEDTTDVEPSLPFPDNLDAARRAQIERLPLTRDAQAYAAWCLLVLARRADVGADLLALHPTVAIALAPVLTAEQRAMVIASPAAQGWESMTHMHWAAACASAEKPTTLPIQRRMR